MHRLGNRFAYAVALGTTLLSCPLAWAQDGDGDAAKPAEDSKDHKACFDLREYDACFREGKAMFAAEDFPGSRHAYP
jgi:hypothetical protein